VPLTIAPFFHGPLAKEGQSVYAPNTLAISVRKDVPQDYLMADERYTEGQPVLMAAEEDLNADRVKELVALGKQIFEEGR